MLNFRPLFIAPVLRRIDTVFNVNQPFSLSVELCYKPSDESSFYNTTFQQKYEKGALMVKKEITTAAMHALLMLKTVEQMSWISGMGENKLSKLLDGGEIEYIQNGNRRLIAGTAIQKWYENAKITVTLTAESGGTYGNRRKASQKQA